MKHKRFISMLVAVLLIVTSFATVSFADTDNNEMSEEAAKAMYVDGFTSTGSGVHEITFNWEPDESADGYILYNNNGGKTVMFETDDNTVTTFTYDTRNYNMDYALHCYCVPYKVINGVKVEGTYKYSVDARPLDLNREDYATDNTTPIIYDVEVPTQKTSKPGTIKVMLEADGTGSPVGTLYVSGEQVPPANVGDYLEWFPERFYDLEQSNFTEKEYFDGKVDVMLDGEGAIEVLNEGLEFRTSSIWLRDAAGNLIFFNMNFKKHGLVTIDEEFDFYFTGALSNANVPAAIKAMDEGQAVALTVNAKSKGIISEEVLRSIAGKDKTIVVYSDEKRSLQWVFYGKELQEPIKDLNLNVKMSAVPGENYGTKGKIIKLEFANNGKLPGDVHFRLKSAYIKNLYGLSDSLYMYYQGANSLLTHEASDCEVVKQGNDYWCYLYLDHNSTFLLSGTKLANSVKGKTIVLSPSSYTYNGKYKAPAVKVKNGSVTLKNGTDYTVTVKKGKNIGKYAVTIKGKGKYSGTETAYYTINPKGTSLKSVKKGKKQFTAKWSKQSAKMPKARITGYQIRYSTKSSMASAKSKTVKGYSKTSLTVKKLSSKKTYYVQVRTYQKVGKSTYYSTWSKAKKVKTK